MARIAQVLCGSQDQPIMATTLVFRSGLSLTSLLLLQTALQQPSCHSIRQLEFVNLWSMEQVQAAIACCRSRRPDTSTQDDDEVVPNPANETEVSTGGAELETLQFTSFRPRQRLRRPGRELAEIFIREFFDQQDLFPYVTCLHIHGYPFGSVGARLLAAPVARNTSLQTLKLCDCDFQSDSATSVAEMIRYNKTLTVLDLSYNPYYLASALTWEMTVKTLIRHGLQHNTTLLEMPLMRSRREGDAPPPQRSKLDHHLQLNRFAHAYFGREQQQQDPALIAPMIWPTILGRAALKAPILHQFVQECSSVLFS